VALPALVLTHETLDHARQLRNGRTPIQLERCATAQKRLHRLEVTQDLGLLL
jgi:hypothetical protein